MSIKANIKMAKLKKATEQIKSSAKDILSEIKGVNINFDFNNKKHTIEIITK